MHCMAKYPIPLESANLNIIRTLQIVYPQAIIGYSDHTSESTKAPVAAVILGAKVVEKHITIDRKLPGPDHSFALNPKELKKMVAAIRKVESKLRGNKKITISKQILGSSERKTYPEEEYVRKFAYRGVFSVRKIKKGEKFTKSNISVLRPGKKNNGLHPRFYETLVKGYRATKDIDRDSAISWDSVLTK
jgi:sialic acid synthase SpsE